MTTSNLEFQPEVLAVLNDGIQAGEIRHDLDDVPVFIPEGGEAFTSAQLDEIIQQMRIIESSL